MSQTILPRLSDDEVRSMATPQNYKAGIRYYQIDAITSLVRQECELWAEFKDGRKTYDIRATLAGEDGIEVSRCTCHYSQEAKEFDLCAHQIAMLHCYAVSPRSFHVIPPLSEILGPLSRDELFTSIELMVRDRPKMLLALELANAQLLSPQPKDLSDYRSLIRYILREADMQDKADCFQEQLEDVRQLVQRRDWLQAGSLYQILLEEITAVYDKDLQADDLEIGGKLDGLYLEFADGLGHCLGKVDRLDPQSRQLWLTTLLEAIFKEMELYEYIDAMKATQALIALTDYVSESESHWIEQRIQAAIRHSEGRQKMDLMSFLERQLDFNGRGEEGDYWVSPEKNAFLLLKGGKLDEALELARTHLPKLPGLMLQFADSLLTVKADERAAQLISEAAEKPNSPWGYQEWLIKFYQEHKEYKAKPRLHKRVYVSTASFAGYKIVEPSDAEIAFERQRQVFCSSPCLEGYKALQPAAERADSWQKLRVEILAGLEAGRHFDVSIEIALYEKDIERALELLPQMTDESRLDHRLTVLRPIQRTQMQAGIARYKQNVEECIAVRKRDKYKIAILNLQRMKGHYEWLEAQAEWETYIQQLRSQHPKLRALQDLLNDAKL